VYAAANPVSLPSHDHQDFLVRSVGYACVVQNDLPKIENLKRLFPQLFRDQPALLAQPARRRCR
jgi:peptide-methionine (S)-S-oxide reductase